MALVRASCRSERLEVSFELDCHYFAMDAYFRRGGARRKFVVHVVGCPARDEKGSSRFRRPVANGGTPTLVESRDGIHLVVTCQRNIERIFDDPAWGVWPAAFFLPRIAVGENGWGVDRLLYDQRGLGQECNGRAMAGRPDGLVRHYACLGFDRGRNRICDEACASKFRYRASDGRRDIGL